MFLFNLPNIKGTFREYKKELEPDVLIQVKADFTQDGQFGIRTLEVTQQVVRVVELAGVISLQIPMENIETTENEPLVGGGQLKIQLKNGEMVTVVTYSLVSAKSFTEAARGIHQIANGEDLNIKSTEEKTRCHKCGRLLPERDGICPACVPKGKTMVRISKFLKPYRLNALCLAFLSLILTLLGLAPPYIQGELVDKVLNPKHNLSMLWTLMGVWLATAVISSIIQLINGRLISITAAGISADIRSNLYRSIQFIQLSYFDKKSAGDIVSRVLYDTDGIQSFLVNTVPYFVTNVLLVVGVIVFMFTINRQLALCVLFPVPIVITISMFCFKPVSLLYYRASQRWSRFYSHLAESVNGIRVVKAFAKEDDENSKFLKKNSDYKTSVVRANNRWYIVHGALMFAIGLGALINWTVGGYMVYNQKITLGEFWKINAYLGLVYGPLAWFAQINNLLSQAMAGAERVFELMDSEPEAYHIKDPNYKIDGAVEFNNVRFGYDKSNPVLKGVSFNVNAGEMIGLVGKSGAGKSTIINLLCRFYEPDSGVIKIDGVDYSKIPLSEMRSQIGVVQQEPFLFNGTLRDNIAYGNPSASFEDIIEAAKAANAHNFILTKPHGYDTVIGERGAQLSGGERQRISIARAILHNPRILILDEATASVDVETEKQIQEAIGRLVLGRTTFAIAHRLSTLRNADRLIVVDRGEIAELGTHEELMNQKGVFYRLVETQSQTNKIVESIGVQ